MHKFPILLILIITFSITNVEAQFEWEVGMEWEYEAYGFFEIGFNKTKFSLVKDTIVDNRNCFILESEYQSCTQRPIRDIVYQENNEIYYYHQQDSAFHLLYDFDAEVGDTLKVRLWDGHDNYNDFIYFLVDSIELVQYANLNLKKFISKVGILENGEFMFYENFFYETIEGIGCTANLFYFHDNGLCDGLYVEDIICFSHPIFGSYVVNPKLCSLTTSINENLNKKESLIIFPNPVHNLMQFKTKHDFSFLEIYNVAGKLLYRDEFIDTIDLSNFENGYYYIRFISDQISYSTGFLKN